MKTFFVVCVLAAAVASVLAGDGDILDKYDGEAIMTDEIKFKEVYACMMDQAPCGDKQDLKDVGAKVLASNCGDCTPPQKEKFEKLIKLASEKYPKETEQLLARFSKQEQPSEQPPQPQAPELPEQKLEQKPQKPE